MISQPLRRKKKKKLLKHSCAFISLKEMGVPDYPTCLQQLEPDVEKWTGSKLGKEYVETIYHHPAYLTSM